MKVIIIFQPALIAYREKFFEKLSAASETCIKVVAGVRSRETSVVTVSKSASWLTLVENRWFAGRRILVQWLRLNEVINCEHLVLTLNPRFLHNWLYLTLRGLCGRSTVVWGHLHSRSGEYSWTNILRQMQIHLATSLIVYTKSEKAKFARMKMGKLCTALGNSCMLSSDCRPAFHGGLDVPRDILYAGRLDVSKNVGLLLEAFAQIADEIPDLRLVIVGDGDDREMLLSRFFPLIERKRLLFKGWVWDTEELRGLYENTLFTVSPGYAGLNIIQSIAHGVPIVVPREVNHSPEIEACVDGFNCVWFARDDAGSLARAMAAIWSNRVGWYQRREAIAYWTKERYTIEHMVEQFQTMLTWVDQLREDNSHSLVI